MNQWRVVTAFGVVTVFAKSEAQAMNRAKWKAAHASFVFRNRADELKCVRECEVFRLERID